MLVVTRDACWSGYGDAVMTNGGVLVGLRRMRALRVTLMAWLCANVVGVAAFAGPAAAEPGLPTPYPMPTYVVSGSFTVTNAVMKDGCFYHPYVIHFETTPSTDYWAVNVRLTAPDGTAAGGEHKSGTGWAGGKFAGEVYLCDGLDQSGTYTLTGTVSTLGDEGEQDVAMTPATFEVFPLVNVTGMVSAKKITNGVRFIFRTPAQPVNTGVGDPARWRVTYDSGRSKKVTQRWDARYVWRKQFPEGSGRHVLRVYLNDKLARVQRVRA